MPNSPTARMQGQTFGPRYARLYDALYRDKDYASECGLVKCLITEHIPGASNLLELGCGTGGHTRYLARWYRVTAVEKSPDMLAIARRKVGAANAKFVRADIARLPRFDSRFHACVAMFHVINYLPTSDRLKRLLSRVRSLLTCGGIVVFDSWNGEAVLEVGPEIRVRWAKVGKMTIARTVIPSVDRARRICKNDYGIVVLDEHGHVSVFHERHPIRYYFPGELRKILEGSGLELIRMTNNQMAPLTAKDWSIMIVAKRR